MPVEFLLGWIIGCATSITIEYLVKFIYLKGGKHEQ